MTDQQVKIDQQQDTIDALREIKSELVIKLNSKTILVERLQERLKKDADESQERLENWLEAASERDKFETLSINAPKGHTGKVRTRNNQRKEHVLVWNFGKVGARDKCISLEDWGTVETQNQSDVFRVRLEVGSEHIDLNRNGVAELRDELQKLLDFNPQG